MRRDQLNRRTHQTSAAAETERPSSPQVIQRGKAVRHGGGGGVRIFKITGFAAGDYIYNCDEYLVDSSDWNDETAPKTKIVDKGEPVVQVFNMGESNHTGSGQSLSIGDLLIGWSCVDDEGNTRYIGMSPKYAWWKG